MKSPPILQVEAEEEPEAFLALFQALREIFFRQVTGGMSLPSGYVKIAIENGHRNSGFSH